MVQGTLIPDMRIEREKEPQVLPFGRGKGNPQQENVPQRIGHDLLGQAVAAAFALCLNTTARHTRRQPFHTMLGIPDLVGKEAVWAGDQKTYRPRVRLIHVGMVDLGQCAVVDREPDAATLRSRCSDHRLRPGGPTRFYARASFRFALFLRLRDPALLDTLIHGVSTTSEGRRTRGVVRRAPTTTHGWAANNPQP